ncbi:hypothetical protein [Rhodanobacter soli]|uniref:hypothetical protein n=2 Tax=Rhodanobacter soli TaxID=590609 RepID=UPI0031DB92A8
MAQGNGQRSLPTLPRGVVRALTIRSRRTASPPLNSSVRHHVMILAAQTKKRRTKAVPLPVALLCGLYVCLFGIVMIAMASHIGTPLREGMVAPYQVVSDVSLSLAAALVVIFSLYLAIVGSSRYRQHLTLALIGFLLVVFIAGMYDSFHENILQSSKKHSFSQLVDFFLFALREQLSAIGLSIFGVIALLHFMILYRSKSTKQFISDGGDA